MGLKPTIPQKAAGHLIEPAISAPTPRGAHYADTNPLSPPELPPVAFIFII